MLYPMNSTSGVDVEKAIKSTPLRIGGVTLQLSPVTILSGRSPETSG